MILYGVQHDPVDGLTPVVRANRGQLVYLWFARARTLTDILPIKWLVFDCLYVGMGVASRRGCVYLSWEDNKLSP